MCKAIKEMLRVSRQEGEQEGRQEGRQEGQDANGDLERETYFGRPCQRTVKSKHQSGVSK